MEKNQVNNVFDTSHEFVTNDSGDYGDKFCGSYQTKKGAVLTVEMRRGIIGNDLKTKIKIHIEKNKQQIHYRYFHEQKMDWSKGRDELNYYPNTYREYIDKNTEQLPKILIPSINDMINKIVTESILSYKDQAVSDSGKIEKPSKKQEWSFQSNSKMTRLIKKSQAATEKLLRMKIINKNKHVEFEETTG